MTRLAHCDTRYADAEQDQPDEHLDGARAPDEQSIRYTTNATTATSRTASATSRQLDRQVSRRYCQRRRAPVSDDRRSSLACRGGSEASRIAAATSPPAAPRPRRARAGTRRRPARTRSRPPACRAGALPPARPVSSPMKLLRDGPTSSGRPSARQLIQPPEQRHAVLRPPCAKPIPGSSTIRSSGTPAGHRARERRLELALHLAHHVVVDGVPRHVAGVPRMCISTTGHAAVAQRAPAWRDRRARDVVHEVGARFERGVAPRAPSGCRPRSAWRTPLHAAPRSPAPRAASPPRRAPARRPVGWTRRPRRAGRPPPPRAGARAPPRRARSAWRPPSENESGVTFTTPMKKGRARRRRRPPIA